jgi:hydrogenase maturation protein HypF
VRGVIQGVGFRPFVYRAARAETLSGWVQNEAAAVRIEVQGTTAALERFVQTLRERHPQQARVDHLEVTEVATQEAEAETDFVIRSSHAAAAPRPSIPADLATCPECLGEINTPAERRYRYPFTNCTACGPRWSIIVQLPYDRPRTSMRSFALCDACRAEYENPADRRFHAQPIACPRCGPRLELLAVNGASLAVGEAALAQAVAAVQRGEVLALKGLGGFQLLVDATSEAAVQRLRARKQRPDKPLAVMLASLPEVQGRCHVSVAEAQALASPAAPILLLRRRDDQDAANDIAPAVAPGNPYLGAMLPYTPLHHLLLAAVGRPVVCTSGNLAEEPMATDTDAALTRLAGIADAVLTHDRPIVRPVDDSVARVGAGGLQLLRRARGYAPLPIRLGRDGPTILAVGGHLKNTVALRLGPEAILSPHIGDLDNSLSLAVHSRTIDDLLEFFAARPEVVACDLHPDYASTPLAERLAAQWNASLVRVQHHHAHVAACAAEHGIDQPVLGFAWDGTGYGSDGTAWGGEMLICQRAEFRRVAHLRTFLLPGGDRAAREPRRAAFGLLYEMLGAECGEWARAWFAPEEVRLLLTALGRPRLFPRTSSMGRLFDAVAVLCGLPLRVSFEGQAAMALEFAVDPHERIAYPFPLSGAMPAVADWEPLVRAAIADRRAGVPVSSIAARFHNALVELAVAIARQAGYSDVVLTGGCFQNALLSERVSARLAAEGFRVYSHREVPPGDGGIALGQIWVAAC